VRYTGIILDDFESELNTKTPERRNEIKRWVVSTIYPALEESPGNEGWIWLSGTIVHFDSFLQMTYDGFKKAKTDSRSYPWDVFFHSAVEDGKALWPEQWSVKALNAKKEELESINRLSVFYREYQCEVVGDEDQLFKEEYIQWWDGRLEEGDEDHHILSITEKNGVKYKDPIKLPVFVFMGVDPASSTKQTADYSTIVSIAVDADNNRYVLPYYRKHAKPMALAGAILSQHKMYNPKRTHIESVGYQEMLRDYLRNQERYIAGLEKKINPRTSKSSRLETMEPYFFKKSVFLKKGMEELRSELLMYPRGKHDDLLDGLYYAMLNLYRPYTKSTEDITKQEANQPSQQFDWAVL